MVTSIPSVRTNSTDLEILKQEGLELPLLYIHCFIYGASAPRNCRLLFWLPAGVHVRKVNFGRLTKGVLHSKFWVVDRKHVFIGSANMDWRALTQVKPTEVHNYGFLFSNTDLTAEFFQVKELGVVIYNCSSLGKDLQKIFESYWVMGQPNSSLPQPWPSQYDTDINKGHPLLVEADNVSSKIYLAVSFA